MKQIELEIATTVGVKTVPAFVPFDGAEFCAHHAPIVDDAEWVVSHVRTGYRIPMTASPTRKLAVDLAGKLHAGCPTAALVKRGPKPKEGTRVRARGPHEMLVAEIKNVLGLSEAA